MVKISLFMSILSLSGALAAMDYCGSADYFAIFGHTVERPLTWDTKNIPTYEPKKILANFYPNKIKIINSIKEILMSIYDTGSIKRVNAALSLNDDSLKKQLYVSLGKNLDFPQNRSGLHAFIAKLSINEAHNLLYGLLCYSRAAEPYFY